MPAHFVAGLDLGSTGVKILVLDHAGAEVLVEQRPTPWVTGPGGTTELESAALMAAVSSLLETAADAVARHAGDAGARISSIAVSGMGETGYLVDGNAKAVAPAFAWFDPRGTEQVAAMPRDLRADFAGRTGLPLGAQVSVAKILFLRDRGLDLANLRWLNLPEFVASELGAQPASEMSLASRTGLLDQDTGRAWPEMLAYLGVAESFVPPLVPAGASLGFAERDWIPAVIRGAAVTVAGHDHLVAAVSGGTIPGSQYQVSMGTAEVILRVLDEPPSRAARERLAEYLINCVRHVVDGQFVLVAGVKTGLLMRRSLHLFGISDSQGREELDRQVCALPPGGYLPAGSIVVKGARNDDGVLSLTIPADGVTPPEVFRAVLLHGNDEIEVLLEAMNREVPPATSTLLSGGWGAMESVRKARTQVLPNLRVSARSQDTAFGAAMAASALLETAAANSH
ncbi:FGGY-family carbohydrate kinase [Demequina oxidasica]|uniref:FGGY-family carbohydrate kinase n=1 Tax=Demequina oxidasica TaxID=676199 RepID=UPI0007832B1D|nr:FGGY family carbohydrate kinase [Demequina oxidasica]